MPEAVIVSTARSPIGRAGKGSMTTIRPDDLAAQMVRAALDKVPELDPHDIDDLMMGCGQPGGESGFNIGRQVAVLLGYDFLPGTTVNRYCSSSLQTSRMAFHAIKAGEGDVFISAGVETVSRYAKGNSDGWPDTHNPLYAEAEQRTAKAAESGASSGYDPREDGTVPDIYIAMGQTAENLALYKDVSREDMDHFGVRSQNLAEQALANGFWAKDITPITLADGTVVSKDDGPRAGVTYEAVVGTQAGVPPDGRVTAGNCCPLNDGAAAVVIMSSDKAAALGLTPLARIVATGVSALSPEIMGLRPGRGVAAGARRRRHDDRRHRPGRDQRGLRRAGAPVVPRAGHRHRQAQRQRRRDRGRPPVRHDRCAHHVHADQLAAVPRQAVRPRDDVRRRRPGHGDGARAPVLSGLLAPALSV